MAAGIEIWPGDSLPLGATWDGSGTNFSIFSEVATSVELCLFDDDGVERRVRLPEMTAFCWHGYVPGVKPGQRYGFRVHGPWDPAAGHRCNPNKLLLDPYALAISGEVKWGTEVLPYVLGNPDDASSDDSAPFVPRSVVVDPAFDWKGDRRPKHVIADTVIYEVHVKGFTQRMTDVPEEIRGTYAGLAHPAAVDYLKTLGVTAVELLPVHHFIHDGHLVEKGLRNYWGYNSIGYLAAHGGYSSDGDTGGQVSEFKEMVKALHAAGLEVILDVVYNHTAEGNHLGPMLSLKGIDNAVYYRTVEDDRRYYQDYTGTGNSMNMQHPHTLQLIMDSLRYWAQEMHVDGFRFDLAATLARELYDVDKLSTFFDIVHQDPVLNRLKLIATLGEFAARLTGSADLYQDDGRKPYASVNFITAHDGFTLRDLVSYNEKHNEANGEENKDGESHNRSWNLGAEGPTDDGAINAARGRQQRNMLTTLLLSQGVPMLLGGDEMGRTQQRNNNAYCQDNEISWFDWEHADQSLIEFTRSLIVFRRQHPIFRRRRWFKGEPVKEGALPDVAWFKPDAHEMTDQDWSEWHAKSFAVFMNGDALRTRDRRGRPLRDDSFCMFFNAHGEGVIFTVPGASWGQSWDVVIDTAAEPSFDVKRESLAGGAQVTLTGLSLLVLRRR